MLEVRCGNCTRRGRLRIDKLIDEYGRDMSLPDLRKVLAGDCEHKTAARRKDQCQVFYPQLRELKREGARLAGPPGREGSLCRLSARNELMPRSTDQGDTPWS